MTELDEQIIPLLKFLLNGGKPSLCNKGPGAAAVFCKAYYLDIILQIQRKSLAHTGLGICIDLIKCYGAVSSI